ncbi:PD-(D/E)XK nuclease family protein [Fructobacillus papyrifericola]|uniref:ATP-dependent helicase n=1 Tax=Fructobacillus papyrifericola TaxID=2713172 RepID=A0ABS5QRF4_9LACO|nr:PD-(D/E)XK nuclease family protein [Fructobacillus papyrifericola]MBS9335766.1 ATP-dependent helicase [Fructobacillus papyrifericola]
MTVTVNIAAGEIDSRQALVQAIADRMKAGEKRRIFYLVPNHVKFDGEVDVLSRLAQANGKGKNQPYAQSQLQVYSMSRLAWRLLDDEGLTQPAILGSAGLFVLVSNILKEEKDRLPIFARMAAKKGFIEKLVAQLTELRASRVSAEDLLTIVEAVNGQDKQEALTAEALKQKLRDLAIVADSFNKKMGEDYLLAQEMLPDFASRMKDADLSDAIFYFDGFTGFTAAEWAVVKLLIEKGEVQIALLGRVAKDDPLKYQTAGSVFEKPLETARTIREMAKQAGQTCQIKVLEEESQSKEGQPGSTSQAEAKPGKSATVSRKNLLQAWEKLGAYQDFSADEKQVAETNLHAFVAANAVAELEEVARRIREDLRLNPDLHLRDILVLARDLNPYSKHLPAVMDAFDLSYFLDNDVKMGNHPLVELTTTLLANPSALYQKDQLLTVLKTGYLRPIINGQLLDDEQYFEAVAYLEKYLDGHRVSKKTWQDDSRGFALFELPADETEGFSEDAKVNRRLSQLKVFIHQRMEELKAALDGADTNLAAARALMTFLVKAKVPEAVQKQGDYLLEKGDLIAAQRVREVWQLFVNILDQVVSIAGADAFSRQTFLSALQAGFSGGTFSGIPNQLDQLTVSEAGIVQSQKYKKLYFIGATRNALPAQIKNKSLLSDQDRLLVQPALADQEDPRYLQETAKQQMASEALVFYNALQAASDSVTFSYPLLDQDGGLNEASPYVLRLTSAFGIDELTTVKAQAENLSQLASDYAGTAAATLSQLVKLPNNEKVGPDFDRVKEVLDQAGYGKRTERVLSSQNYENKTKKLSVEIAKRLFQGPLMLSISQVESFYRNPYEYFLKYGLRLKEKPTVEINNMLEGTIYHTLFEGAVLQVVQQTDRLADLADERIDGQVDQLFEEQLQLPEYAELTEAGQGQAQANFMAKQAKKVLKNLRDVARLSNTSRPTQVEEQFGMGRQGLPAMVMADQTGQSVKLRGKVDRFDRQDAAGDFGTIVDYKLNGKKFNYADAANGLELQLLAYWQAANENAQAMGMAAEGQVAGAFFAPINDQVTSFKDFKGDFGELLAGQLKAPGNKLHGLYLDNEDYVDALDYVEYGQPSKAYAIAKKQKGGFNANQSDVVSADELSLLMARNRQLILNAAAKIAAGDFDIAPSKQSLTYSKYTDVMRFDAALGDQYQNFTYQGKKGAVLKALENNLGSETDGKEADNA